MVSVIWFAQNFAVISAFDSVREKAEFRLTVSTNLACLVSLNRFLFPINFLYIIFTTSLNARCFDGKNFEDYIFLLSAVNSVFHLMLK